MDFGGPPVGTSVNPVGQGLQTLSDVMNFRRSQQALQTGALQQQGIAADVQQKQQQNQEMQQVHGLLQQVHQGGYRDKNGNLDSQKLATDLASIGPYAGDSAARIIGVGNDIVSNQKALQALTEETRGQIGGVINSLATNPATTRRDVTDSVADWIADHANDPNAVRVGKGVLRAASSLQDGPQLRSALSNIAGEMTGKAQSAPSTVDQGATIQPGQTLSATGEFTPAGAPIKKTFAPNQFKNEAGQTVNVSPSGAVSVAPTAGNQNANPTTAQATVQNAAAAGISARVQQAQAAANNTIQAQDALTRARSILDQGGVNTGKGFETFKDLKNLMSGLGVDTQGATDANSLVKNLARYEAARATQAGLGGTDAARELAHNGSPNVSIDNAALKGIVTQSLATEKALAAYANVQAKAGNDGQKLAQNESSFRNIPNLIEGYEYGLARTPQEADEFLRQHGLSAADMKKTRQAIKQFEGQ